MTRRRRLLIALCVLVTVLPAAVAGLGLVSTETSAGQTPCGGPTPTVTPGPTPSPTPLCKPTLTKAFSPDTVQEGNFSTLTFTVTNPNPAVALFDIAFSDTLPAGIAVIAVSSTTCGGTTVAGASQIDVSQVTVAAGSSCTINVLVITTASGVFVNTTSQITASGVGGPGPPASATLTVTPAYAQPLVTDLGVTGQTVFFSLRSRSDVGLRVDKRVRARRYRRVHTMRIAHAKRGRHRVRLRRLSAGRYRVSVRGIARGDRGLALRRTFTVR